MIRSRLWIVTIFSLIFLAGRVAFGQTTDASITGTVTDTTGAVIPEAALTAQNVDTGVATHATSNGSGVYLFPSLVPGSYTLRAEKASFKPFVYQAFQLDIRAQAKLDVRMEVGATSETVQVTAEATQLSLSSANVGQVVETKQILDLPLQARSSLDLLATVGGVALGPDGTYANINGNRSGATVLSLDGVNVNENLTDGLAAVNTAEGFSVDRVEEFRVITAPADAELGRGSAQVQMISRGGTNQFHGSVFEENRNTDLAANNWFNNAKGDNPITGAMNVPRPKLIRNQFGARLGGPIIRNKTFFNFTYEGQRQIQGTAENSLVYTAAARQGVFRYFPGTRNANVSSTTTAPVVDTSGNPVQAPGATGPLQSVNVLQTAGLPFDPTGAVGAMLKYMPLPNNYLVGDGLDTAGYAWNVPTTVNGDRYVLRIDHQLLNSTRLAFNLSKEALTTTNPTYSLPAFPSEPPNLSTPDSAAIYSLAATTVITPTLINELLIGINRPREPENSPVGTYSCTFCTASQYYPQATSGEGYYQLHFTNNVASPLYSPTGPYNGGAPTYQYGDSVTWLRGKHAFKGGATLRFIGNSGYNIIGAFPLIQLGTTNVGGSPAVQALPGIGLNATTATNLVADLAGDIASGSQAEYSIAGGPFQPYIGRYRDWHTKEFSAFFKDDWKITDNITLNLGIRYELYSVWSEAHGNGQLVLPSPFGISGGTYAALFNPGAALPGAGTLYTDLTVPNHQQFYKPDWNNFAPAEGISWSLPWFGKGKTVLRAGYSWAYIEKPAGLFTSIESFMPGLTDTIPIAPTTLSNLTTLALPLAPNAPVLGPLPFNRGQQTGFFDPNLRTPYVQNYNFSIARALPGNWSVDFRFIGSKGTKLIRTVDLNEVNIFENGILNAFLSTQQGGNAPLFNQIFNGLNIPGLGVVDGVNITGSQAIRTMTATQGFLANNNVAGLANYLNTTTTFTGTQGGLLARAGLPQNFITVNPQGSNDYYMTNDSNSTYNSAQVEVNHRFSSGFLMQSNFTWSKAISDLPNAASGTAAVQNNYRTNRDLALDKAALAWDHAAVWRSNGVWELPFGKGKLIGGGAGRFVNSIIGGWQTGAIITVQSGAPISFVSSPGSFNLNNTGGDTPALVGNLSSLHSGVEYEGNGVAYFGGAQQVADPSRANITTLNNIRGLSTLYAVANSSGQVVLVNPLPGQLGTLGNSILRGPGLFNVDLNLIKRFQIRERVTVQLQADALSLTNTPQFANPTAANLNINSATFGTITSTLATATGGARVVVVKARITF